MYYYTYRIDFVDGYYYLGVRQCECKPNEDVYYGSPLTHKDKWNTTMFTKTIISEYNSRDESMEAEKELIGDNYKNDPMCLNEHNGIHFDRAGSKHTDESRDKMRKSMKGRVISDETRAKISNALKGKKKPKRTQQHIDNISKARKGQEAHNKGTKQTEETKSKISNTLKGRKRPDEVKKKISDTLKKRFGSRKLTDQLS